MTDRLVLIIGAGPTGLVLALWLEFISQPLRCTPVAFALPPDPPRTHL
jgi:2-polyprenyl-6-methoxyphenol hydroxylase-like FAD-dependent oxidoreductase